MILKVHFIDDYDYGPIFLSETIFTSSKTMVAPPLKKDHADEHFQQ